MIYNFYSSKFFVDCYRFHRLVNKLHWMIDYFELFSVLIGRLFLCFCLFLIIILLVIALLMLDEGFIFIGIWILKIRIIHHSAVKYSLVWLYFQSNFVPFWFSSPSRQVSWWTIDLVAKRLMTPIAWFFVVLFKALWYIFVRLDLI